MGNKRNLRQFQLYLRPRQIESLNSLRSQIKNECDVKFPLSELMRDAVDQFIVNITDEELRKCYMESKGW